MPMTSPAQKLRTPRARSANALRGPAAVGLGVALGALAFGAGTAAAQPPGVVCATPAAQYGLPGSAPVYGLPVELASDRGNPDAVTLTRRQLLINQRISQAAIRRVEAVQNWLDAGIVGTDICGGALGPEDLGGISFTTGPAGDARPAPSPRALQIQPIGGGDPSEIRLSREQLLINQRISQAAVRRANALRQRLLGGLTGGDVRDGSITGANIRPGVRITAAPPVPNPPAATVTNVAPPATGSGANVTLSARQLLINQRISQSGVRRANALIAKVRTGLNGTDFRTNSITGVDLASGVVQP
jgi:hypothetical protein